MADVVLKFVDIVGTQFDGRYLADGDRSAEWFRREMLEPILERGDRALVDLTGLGGYYNSDVHEAFACLRERYSSEFLRRNLHLSSRDNIVLVAEIWLNIDEFEAEPTPAAA